MGESPFGRRTDLRASPSRVGQTQGEPAPARRRMSLRYLRRLGRSLQRGMRVREPFTSRDAAEELALLARGALDAPSFRREVLRAYRGLVPYDTAVFSEQDHRDPLTVVEVDRPALELIRHCELNFHRYLPHLRKRLEVAAREGGFLDHEVFSSRERDTLPLYCEVVRPQGIRSSLVLAPTWRGRALGLIRLQRHGGLPFSRRDFDCGTQLLPTIELGLVALRSALPPGELPAPPTLTEREEEIAYHVGRGLSTPHIALLLGTSPFTVRNQISRVFDKTGVSSRAELAAWVAQRSISRQ